MFKILSLLIGVPIIVIAVMFAIYNQGPVTLDLRPFSSSLDMPVFWVVLGTLLIGVLLGMLMTWLAQGKYRAMARSYRSQAISLRTEADLARARAEAAEAKANA